MTTAQDVIKLALLNLSMQMQFQRRLIELGYLVGTFGSTGKGDDGTFGEESFKALKQFQQEHGLEVDGVLGAESWYKAWKLLEPALV